MLPLGQLVPGTVVLPLLKVTRENFRLKNCLCWCSDSVCKTHGVVGQCIQRQQRLTVTAKLTEAETRKATSKELKFKQENLFILQ